MVIYGDILFLVNLYIDYFLLLAVKRFLHLRASRPRLALGALLGGAFSLLSLIPLPNWLTYPLSLVFAALITLLALAPKDKLALFKATACFFCFSFIFGGIVLLLSQVTGAGAVIAGSVYFDISPFFLFLFTLLAYLISLFFEKVRGAREPDCRFCKIIVEQGEAKVELLAKIDTGNSLKEPFSDLPVLVAEKESLAPLLQAFPQNSFRLVPFHSLGGNGLLPAFQPQRIYLKGNPGQISCFLALYDGRLSAGSWNCLVNPQAIDTIPQNIAPHRKEDGHNHETTAASLRNFTKAIPTGPESRTLSLHQRPGNSSRPPFAKG